MAYTSHGHHIANTIASSIADQPKNPARCGGTMGCRQCISDVRNYWENPTNDRQHENIMVGENTDYQAKAKQMVGEYVDSKYRQNFPNGELPTYTVYVIWFAKTLQNWKAVLGTDMPDGYIYELTYNGDDKVTYFDAYHKVDNFPIIDRS